MTKKSMALAAGILSVTIAGIGWDWTSNHQSSAKNSPLGEVCKAGDCISVEKAAEQGDANAQYAVGVAHITGKGLPKDDAAAVKWLGKAAAQGHRDAQFFIATAYQNGLGGLKADIAESAKWLSKAAAQGHAQAQHILGALYYEGRGVKQDYTESEKLWRLSAEQGIPESQFNLGALYFEGRGVAKNNNESLKWLIAVAEGGNKQAPDVINRLGYSWPALSSVVRPRSLREVSRVT
ncbi:MAG: tetratricopeptide repeat protein [Deltaproteobacteria bacterium]|nr:tetratricopeptide repeat protein [Deltaproteobacteria bacterium]